MATVSLARTSRTKLLTLAASVVDPVTKETALVVPVGTVDSLIAWLGDDRVKAEAVKGHRFRGVRDAAEAVLADG